MIVLSAINNGNWCPKMECGGRESLFRCSSIFFTNNQRGIMIAQSNGLAVRCQLCTKIGPLVRYDANRYNRIGPGYAAANEFYTQDINKKVQRLALEEGFVQVKRQNHVINGLVNQPPAVEEILDFCPNCAHDMRGVSDKFKNKEDEDEDSKKSKLKKKLKAIKKKR